MIIIIACHTKNYTPHRAYQSQNINRAIYTRMYIFNCLLCGPHLKVYQKKKNLDTNSFI